MSGFLSQKFHAFIDYPVALGLLIMPALLGLTGMAATFSMVTGVAALILTVLTDHETGLFGVLHYKDHLAVDAMVGLLLLAAPFLFGFGGSAQVYFLAIGAIVVAVVSLNKKPARAMAHPAE